MAIDTTPSAVATNALSAIPFGSIIGGPLNACIDAQAMAAKTTWNFIQEVGLYQDSKTGEKKAVNVSFQFMQNGQMVQLNVPLLTIVPIPYIAINSIDINFKASISASSSSVQEDTSHEEMGGSAEITAGLKVGPFHMDAKMNANYSSKKDSKATQESKYSVEYTMDVAVKAGQDSMPAGLAKVLELLGNSLDISNPSGTLDASSRVLEGPAGEMRTLIVTYKNGQGLYAPDSIQLAEGTAENTLVDDKSVRFEVKIPDEASKLVLTAGEGKEAKKLEIALKVKAAEG